MSDVHVTSDASPGNWEQGRARATVTRHATYIVAAHVSGAARYQEHHLEQLRPTISTVRTELAAVADPEHPRVTRHDLSTNANRR